MSKTLITPEVEARIERRIEFANEDGNLMRAGSQYTQYNEDVELLLSEVDRLQSRLTEVQGFHIVGE